MAPRTLPGIGLQGYETAGTPAWNTWVDPNWRLISAWLQARVTSVVSSLPGSPSDGDVHIVTTGVDANSLAVRDNGAWVYMVPQTGYRVYDQETALHWAFDGAAWKPEYADLTATTDAPSMVLRKRGSGVGATEPVASEGALGYYQFQGWTGAAWRVGAQMFSHARELWSGTASGTQIVFQVVANGATALADKMRLSATELWVDVPITGVAAQKMGSLWCAYSGAADAINLTYGLSSVVAGVKVRFRASAANTGATTINLDGIGAVTCKTITGVDLPAGYIRTDVTTEAEYDGTNWIVDRQIERGSNADGAWTRLADGTLECHSTTLTQDASTAAGSMYRSIAATWNLPATMMNSAFTAYPGTLSNSATHWGSARPVDASSVEYVIYSFGSYAGLNIRISAVGRWY